MIRLAGERRITAIASGLGGYPLKDTAVAPWALKKIGVGMTVKVYKSGGNGQTTNIYHVIGIVSQTAQCRDPAVLNANVSAIRSCSVPGKDKSVIDNSIKRLRDTKNRRSSGQTTGASCKAGTCEQAPF